MIHILVVRRDLYLVERWRKSSLLPGRYRLADVYKCALGQAGHETPTGMFYIRAKSRAPEWRMPDSDWVPEERRGEVIPFGHPDNPFATGFMALADGVGIHDTVFDPQLGAAASHGCIRVSTPDLAEIYAKCARGTAVYVV
jgi:L,D-transpeptidase YnhG